MDTCLLLVFIIFFVLQPDIPSRSLQSCLEFGLCNMLFRVMLVSLISSVAAGIHFFFFHSDFLSELQNTDHFWLFFFCDISQFVMPTTSSNVTSM